MADHSMLFSAPMILALLREIAERGCGKTMTRRLPNSTNVLLDGSPIGTSKEVGKGNRWIFDSLDWSEAWVDQGPSPAGNPGPYWHVPCAHPEAGGTTHRVYPKVQPGDRLWVRENGLKWIGGRTAWKGGMFIFDASPGRFWCDATAKGAGRHFGASYATQSITRESQIKSGKWKVTPSIHQPRWASRITLLEPVVKLERLHDISEDDAQAEGVETDAWDMCAVARDYRTADGWFQSWSEDAGPPYVDFERLHRASFETLWDSLHGVEAWAKNPWLLVTAFRPVAGNIDDLAKVT